MLTDDDLLGPLPFQNLVHVREGNRVSLLPVTKYCGAAAKHSQSAGSGRAAIQSSWFHAFMAAPHAPETETLWRLMTEKEQEEAEGWKPVLETETEGGVVLRYAEAQKELEVVLELGGIRSVGHLDMMWGPLKIDGIRTVFVGDIKRQAFTSQDGPESLQLHGYGWAACQKYDAEAYVTGLWLASEGEWRWSTQPVLLDSDEGEWIRGELEHAMRVRDEYAPDGVHCRSCYGRLRCPQYVLAAIDAPSWVEPLTREGDLNELDDATLKRLLLAGKQMEELGEAVVKQVNAVVDRGRWIRDEESGKVYASVECKGRASVSVKSLREQMGDAADQYIKRGAGFTQKRWMVRT